MRLARLGFFVLLPLAAQTGRVLVNESAFTAPADLPPAGWTKWSARAETAPRCYVDALIGRRKSGSLAVSGASNIAAHGGWRREVPGIEPGSWYRFTAYYRTSGVEHETWQVLARVNWSQAAGKRAGRPDYVSQSHQEGAWTRVTMDVPAPPKASTAWLELFLSNAPQGTVWWDDISLETIAAPAPRPVTVAVVNLRPQGQIS